MSEVGWQFTSSLLELGNPGSLDSAQSARIAEHLSAVRLRNQNQNGAFGAVPMEGVMQSGPALYDPEMLASRSFRAAIQGGNRSQPVLDDTGQQAGGFIPGASGKAIVADSSAAEMPRQPATHADPCMARALHVDPPRPLNEDRRQQCLDSCNILDTPAEPRFDDITNLVCSIFRLPIAIVSLVDRERQWFKSVVGLGACTSTERSSSFCAWTLLPAQPEVLVVSDATADVRFKNNPLVLGDPWIRFYAGAPLVSSTGLRYGSLCVIDRRPRQFDAESCNLLCNFAEVVVREIEKEKLRANKTKQLEAQASGLLTAIDCFKDGIMLVDTSTPLWTIIFINDTWTRVTGIDKDRAVGCPLWELFVLPGHKEETMQSYRSTAASQVSFDLELSRGMALPGVSFTAAFRPASHESVDANMPPIGIPGSIDWPQGKADAYYFATIQMRQTTGEHEEDERWRPHVIMPKKEPFDDVLLGPLLGQGSFGRVYRGIWNGAQVAIKVIQSLTTPYKPKVGHGSADSFENGVARAPNTVAGSIESMMSVDLAHPNIVQTFKSTSRAMMEPPSADRTGATGSFATQPREGSQPDAKFTETWLVLEFCDRGCLQEAIDRGMFCNSEDQFGRARPHLPYIRATGREIASAMSYLHSLDILHGDLSGGNILLASSDIDDRRFTAKVADFGLSRILSAESISTGTYGTVTHMPPELLTTGKLSKAADVYAFGVLLWEMWTGSRPWSGLLQMQVIFHVTIQRKCLEFPADTPLELKELALACMSREPRQRPRFEEVVERLGSNFCS
ncbi:hypothetical protein WJX84_006057 [Apatococcus fuscideae]|uniref:Protein kinase domain-containing protein n=1 Tax=Apatococcus fuscideae TaxID=2026836 RepID=A0AAW1SDB5_9CHLO